MLSQHQLLRQTPQPSNHSETGLRRDGRQVEGDGKQGEVAVLLVSFLRDLSFWRENLSRLGIDLDAAGRRGRFGFVDGLGGGLFSTSGAGGQQQQQQQNQRARQGWEGVLSSAVPGEIERVVLEGVERLKRPSSTVAADGEGREKRVVLVIDGLDFVLAALDPSLGLGQGVQGAGETPGMAIAMKEMLMELREVSLSLGCCTAFLD